LLQLKLEAGGLELCRKTRSSEGKMLMAKAFEGRSKRPIELTVKIHERPFTLHPRNTHT